MHFGPGLLLEMDITLKFTDYHNFRHTGINHDIPIGFCLLKLKKVFPRHSSANKHHMVIVFGTLVENHNISRDSVFNFSF